MNPSPKFEQALQYAVVIHAGQVRKGAGDFWARCTPGGPESGKKIQIWKIFFEIQSADARISGFDIDEMWSGVVKFE
jgi:hypothetical protein